MKCVRNAELELLLVDLLDRRLTRKLREIALNTPSAIPSPTDCSLTKRMPFTPPLESPSRRHPAGGIDNEIFSPVQSNVSRGNSCGWAGGAGVDLHAVAAKTTRARQAGSAAYRQRSSNLIR